MNIRKGIQRVLERIIERDAIEWNMRHSVENPYGNPDPNGPSWLIRGTARALQLAAWNGVCGWCGKTTCKHERMP